MQTLNAFDKSINNIIDRHKCLNCSSNDYPVTTNHKQRTLFTGGLNPISHIISINNTLHTALYNYNNSFCYHISVVQRLHSSSILTAIFRDNRELFEKLYTSESLVDVIVHEILKVLEIYAQLTPVMSVKDSDSTLEDTILQTYTQIQSYYNNFVPEFVHDNAMHGYYPHRLMYYTFLPAVYHFLRFIGQSDMFVEIVQELHLDIFNFVNVVSTYTDYICGEDKCFLKHEEHRNLMLELYRKMLGAIPETLVQKPFVSAVLEVSPSKDFTGCHAITLVKSKDNELYIIDDQNAIAPLVEYYQSKKERLYEITIRDIDEITAIEINNYLHGTCEIPANTGLARRISRFTINFDDNFLKVDQVMYQDVNSTLEDVRKEMLSEVGSLKSSIKDTAAKLALSASRTALASVGVLGQKALDSALVKAQKSIEKRIYGGGSDGNDVESDDDEAIEERSTGEGVKKQMSMAEFCIMMFILGLIVTLVVVWVVGKLECKPCQKCECEEL